MTPSEIPLLLVAVNELSIVGSTAYSRNDFRDALDALADGRIAVDRLITSVVDLDATDDALRRLASGSGDDVKVLISHETPLA
jgi:threonine dehydrogenase-like Zn-dependent dehydrogenase